MEGKSRNPLNGIAYSLSDHTYSLVHSGTKWSVKSSHCTVTVFEVHQIDCSLHYNLKLKFIANACMLASVDISKCTVWSGRQYKTGERSCLSISRTVRSLNQLIGLVRVARTLCFVIAMLYDRLVDLQTTILFMTTKERVKSRIDELLLFV